MLFPEPSTDRLLANLDSGQPSLCAYVFSHPNMVEVAGVALQPIWYVDIYPENALAIALFALGATLLAGLYPAWRAGRVEPVEAIKLV